MAELKYNSNIENTIQEMSSKEKNVVFDFIEHFDEKNVLEWKNKKWSLIFYIKKIWEYYVIENIRKEHINYRIIVSSIFMVIVIIIVLLIVKIKFYNQWDPNIWPSQNIDSILSWFVYTWETNNVSWDNTVIIPVELTDYQKFLELSKKNTISLYSPNNPVYSSFDPSDWVWNTTKVENIRNKHAKYIQNPKHVVWSWYLYIVASVNNWILSEKESVYLYFWDFWGHLYKKYSLDVPSDGWKLHLLYPLDKIVFAKLPTRWYDDNKEMDILRTQNWQEKFNTTNNNIYFFWFVSTSRQWKLEEVRIVYE